MAYGSYIIPKYFGHGATVALMPVSRSLRGSASEFVPVRGQILGRITTPVAPSPFSFEIRLPIEPSGDSIDLDNNGKRDAGVQVFAAVFSLNLFGDSYLEQLEQNAGFTSILTDPRTGAVAGGTLLVYAPDARQKGPAGAGEDGRLFTDDDPVVRLPRGYSLLRIGAGGVVHYERTRFVMDLLEPVSVESPDFSGQGILASFNSLLDVLQERYAYTDLRGIDWKQLRERYLPRVTALDAGQDMAGYYTVLHELATGIHDGHVGVNAPYTIRGAHLGALGQLWSGELGMAIVRLSDSRFVVTTVGKGSPADRAGLTPGTEIVSLGGKPTAEHLNEITLITSPGTRERADAMRMPYLSRYPIGQPVEVGYRLPGDASLKTVRLVAADHSPGTSYAYPADTGVPFQATMLAEGAIGYVRWTAFDDVAGSIAGWERFLAQANGRPGMIIDLRGNGGGLMVLMYTMASYLFPPDKAASLRWLDTYEYDAATKSFVKAPGEADVRIHAPRPDLAFAGDVVELVDGRSASAAEYFAQFLQRAGRATVVAEQGTDGAGGTMRQVAMPGKMVFTYTGSRTYFAGTREVNIEGKGIIADVRVPITEENERRKLAGDDVVLSRAIEVLRARQPKAPEAAAARSQNAAAPFGRVSLISMP